MPRPFRLPLRPPPSLQAHVHHPGPQGRPGRKAGGNRLPQVYNKSRAGLGRSQASLLGLLSAWRLPITSRQRLINRYHGTVCRRLWRQCEIHYCPSSPVANGGSAPGGAWTDPLSVYYFSNHTSEWNLGWEMTRSSRMCHADGQLVGGVWQGGGPRDQPCCQPLSWREALHLWPGSRLQVYRVSKPGGR